MSNIGRIAENFTLAPNPAYIESRDLIFDRLQRNYTDRMQYIPEQIITITLPNGDIFKGFAFKTTPIEIASSISSGLADSVLIAKVIYSTRLEEDLIISCDQDEVGTTIVDISSDGELWDLHRPLIGDCTIKLLKYEDHETKAVSRVLRFYFEYCKCVYQYLDLFPFICTYSWSCP
jgi:threonyl-tRNA synthetase